MKSILAVFLAFVLGAALGHLLGGDAASVPEPAEERHASAEPGASEARVDLATLNPSAAANERAPVDSRQPAPADAPADASSDDLIGEALRAHAREGIALAWSRARNETIPDEDLALGMAQFEEFVLSIPYSIGTQLAEQRTRSEMLAADARRGGAFTLLEKLDAGEGAPVLSLVHDTAAFDALFVREAPEHGVDLALAKTSSREELTDGSTFVFPAGCFLIDNLLERGANSVAPKDFTIAGAGMDATLLVLDEDLGSRGPIRNFTLRDCTVHTDSNYLFDHRRGAATVTLERVRVVGFDMGAGSSCAFALGDGVVLSVRSCRFEGGFGRNPGSGTLFDMRTDAFVARFDGTLVQHVALGFEHIRPNATVLFANCRLENVFSWRDPFETVDEHAGIELVATTLTLHEKAQGESLERDLDELFPGWQQRLER
jgi:hypothetical protein